jgi:MoaA/NifB/PqqE/SkfB family radical SAM enzyme
MSEGEGSARRVYGRTENDNSTGYDYANILFTGGLCNLGCHGCIGESGQLKALPRNLDGFPPKNIDGLIEAVNQHEIPDLAFTGTNVDPQLYRHEQELIGYVRERLTGATKLALHTNGILALEKIDVFNSYDKASVSYHSFNTETYARMTRTGRQPDLRRIIEASEIPIKLSMLVTEHNAGEIDDYLKRCADLGIGRVVIRKLKGAEERFPLESLPPFSGLAPVKEVFGWPVYEVYGTEATICGFDKSTARGLFLFSDGRLENYLVR